MNVRVRNRARARLWASYAQDDLHHDSIGIDTGVTQEVSIEVWARVLVASPCTVGPQGLGPDRPRDAVADAALRAGIEAARAEGLSDPIEVARRAAVLAMADGHVERFAAGDDKRQADLRAELARLDREALAARERNTAEAASGNA